MPGYKEKIIAVVGVSRDPGKYGYRIFHDLVAAGYKVFGVNPGGGKVAGRKLIRHLKEITPLPELVITVVPPSETEKIIEECKALGLKTVWMQPGSESDSALKKAKACGLNAIAGDCFMVREGLW
jgi:uncharacterized protein